MEINSIQNSYYPINTTNNISREKKAAEEISTTTAENNTKDTVEISSDGNFKSELGTYSKTFQTQSKQAASQDKIDELKTTYSGDNCPVSGIDIASAIMKYTFGKTGQE